MSTKTIMDTNGSRRPRRSWPEALKREIVAASLEPGASVSLIARRYDVNTNQLFSWRRLYRCGSVGLARGSGLPIQAGRFQSRYHCLWVSFRSRLGGGFFWQPSDR